MDLIAEAHTDFVVVVINLVEKQCCDVVDQLLHRFQSFIKASIVKSKSSIYGLVFSRRDYLVEVAEIYEKNRIKGNEW